MKKSFLNIFKVQNLFLIMCLFWGTVFLFLNPPFQAPDEDAHFFKMYGFTTGSLNFKKENGYGGQILPESFINIQKYFDYIRLEEKNKTSLREIEIVSSVELKPDNVAFHRFIPTWYTPLSYFPSFIVLWLLKLLNVKPLFMIYIMRYCSLLTYMALMYGAICLTPVKKWLFFTIGLLPLCVYQAGAISTDGLTFGLGFLLVAYTLRLKLTGKPDEKIGKKQIIFWGLIFIYLCFCKYAYFPLGILYLLLPKSKFESEKLYWLGFWGVNLVNLFVISVFLSINFRITDGMITELTARTVSKTVLIKQILQNPVEYLYNVAYTTKRMFGLYLDTMVSCFGWTITRIPKFLTNIYYLLIYAALSYNSTAEQEPVQILTLKDKLLAVCGIVMSYLIIITSVFLLYQNHTLIFGVQGRYLTIFMIPAALVFTSRYTLKSKAVPVLIAVVSNVLMFASLLTMIGRFY